MRAGRRGFSFPMLLVWVALASLSLATVGPMWSDAARRDRERELLRIGELYAEAIAHYQAVSPGSAKAYPQRLEDLLQDTRFVGTMRHLRRLYADPTNPAVPWAVLTDEQGRIVGVHSQNRSAAVTEAPVTPHGRRLSGGRTYADWRFTAEWTRLETP